MKFSGKVGYLLNLQKEYGNRANALFQNLEEKHVQCAFVTNFIKIDYINITKILLYLIQHNKVKTYFDGLYIDKEFSDFFIHDDKNKMLLNETNEKQCNGRMLKTYDTDPCAIIFEKQQIGVDQPNYRNENKDNPSEQVEHEYTYCDVEKKDYKKIMIRKSDLININEIMNYDGVVENIDKLIYYLNPCSILSAYFLDIKKSDCVLDMCASPGGKSLAIANKLFSCGISPLNRINYINVNDKSVEINCCLNVIKYYKSYRDGVFVSNEFNKMRYDRLKKLLYKYLPKDLINSNNIHITNYNGLNLNSFIRFPKFHKILLDVPCSSDEHLIKKNANYINKWSFNIIVNNSKLQFELLNNSFHLLHINGIIVYSTCAISHNENDNVVEKFIKKYKNKVQVIDFIQEEYKKICQTCCSFHKSQNEQNCVIGDDTFNDINFENVENIKNLYSKHTDSDRHNPNNNIAPSNNNSNDAVSNNHPFINRNDSPCNIHNFNEFKQKSKFLSFFEKTKYGYISLPDKSPFGILYICKIKKVLN